MGHTTYGIESSCARRRQRKGGGGAEHTETEGDTHTKTERDRERQESGREVTSGILKRKQAAKREPRARERGGGDKELVGVQQGHPPHARTCQAARVLQSQVV